MEDFKEKIKFFIFFLTIIIIIKKNLYILLKKKRNLNICICTLGKSENRYIKEFVEYYEKYGVDKIFLYDNNDLNGERLEDPIYNEINKGFVKLFNRRGKKRDQLKILNHCYKNNYNKYDWIIFYDIDEYINLKNYSNLKDFLNESRFNNCQVIYLNWIIHTDNNLIFYQNKSLHERFPILEPNIRNKDSNYFSPVKSILKGHIPNIKIEYLHRINKDLKVCNGFGNKPRLRGPFMLADSKYYFIDHFYFKSLEEFTEKLNRGSAKTYKDNEIKYIKISRYLKMNKINIKKINYLEKKCGINLSKFKNININKLKSKNNIFNSSLFMQ